MEFNNLQSLKQHLTGLHQHFQLLARQMYSRGTRNSGNQSFRPSENSCVKFRNLERSARSLTVNTLANTTDPRLEAKCQARAHHQGTTCQRYDSSTSLRRKTTGSRKDDVIPRPGRMSRCGISRVDGLTINPFQIEIH